MSAYVISELEKERLMEVAKLMEENPKAAFAEGFRRTANLFDELDYIYSAVSSGKDSLFMTNMILVELLRRRYILSLVESSNIEDQKEGKALLERFSKIRKDGVASQNEDDIELFKKWKNMRIGVMSMDYEITFEQSREVMLRFWKEYATDINKICPDGKVIDDFINSEESVKKLGFDLRWVSDVEKENPHELAREVIEGMIPKELVDVYGKALVWGYGMYQPIAWENTGSVDNSRYISFDPDKKSIWVTAPPIEFDPHMEWCITLENLYEPWHGLPPMFSVQPAMTDQNLRVKFSQYISEAVKDGFEHGWPNAHYDLKEGWVQGAV